MICRMQNEMKIKKNIALATIAKYRGEKRARVGELEFSGTRESPRNYRHTYIYIYMYAYVRDYSPYIVHHHLSNESFVNLVHAI